MAAQSTSQTVHDRQKALVEQMQGLLTSRAKFRPIDVALAAEYDNETAILFQVTIEMATVAAVDRHASAIAVELHKQRKEFALAAQKQSDTIDQAMQAQSAAIAQSFLPNIVPFLPKAPAQAEAPKAASA